MRTIAFLALALTLGPCVAFAQMRPDTMIVIGCVVDAEHPDRGIGFVQLVGIGSRINVLADSTGFFQLTVPRSERELEAKRIAYVSKRVLLPPSPIGVLVLPLIELNVSPHADFVVPTPPPSAEETARYLAAEQSRQRQHRSQCAERVRKY